MHALKFGDIQKLRILIERLEDNSNLDTNILLNLALAYNKVGNAVKAKYLLDSITNGYTYDTLKYLAISTI